MAQAAASSVNKEMEISMERLSTGKRINGAADDAAGVAIASRLSAEIRGTDQAIRNALDAQALIDTAEGAHIEIESILQRMRELSVQARNDTNDAQDRTNLQAEMNQLTTEIDRISSVSSWAGQKLLTGSGGNNANGTFNFQVGSQTNSADLITATISSMSAAALGVGAGNATAGANGATLTEVGENVLQLGGTPVVGDTYSTKINGETVTLEIAAVSGAAFTYKLNGVAAAAVAGATGQTKGDVAIALKAAIDAKAGVLNPGLTTTTNTDGTVTVTQGKVVTGGSDVDGAGTTNAEVAWAVTSGNATVTNATTGATGEAWAAGTAYEITISSTTTAEVAAETFSLTINGTSIVAATAISAVKTAGYTPDALGVANYLADKLALATNTKGFSLEVGHTGTNVYLKAGQTAANLITNESAVAGASSTALSVSSVANAKTAIDKIDLAIKSVNSQRATLGAISNRLDSTVSNLTNVSQNLQGGRGRIEDADFAAETTNLAKTQILQQASTAMLAQANAAKQNVLSLLQG